MKGFERRSWGERAGASFPKKGCRGFLLVESRSTRSTGTPAALSRLVRRELGQIRRNSVTFA